MWARTRPAVPARLRRLGAVGFALAILVAGRPAAAESKSEQALQLHDEARTLYGAGKYQEAIARLERAVRLDPKAKILFYNLGLIEEKLGRLDDALRHYRQCLELERDPREKEQLGRIIDRVEGAQRHGPSNQRPSAPGDQPQAPPAASASDGGTVNPWVWVTGATAVSALAVGFGLGARAAALHPGGDATTGPDVSLADLQDDAEQAHSLAIGADVAFGLAFAATAATVVLALTTSGESTTTAGGEQPRSSRRRRPQPEVRLELAPGWGRLAGRF